MPMRPVTSLDDLLLHRLSRLPAASGSMLVRLRDSMLGRLQGKADAMIGQARLPATERRRGGTPAP